MKLEHFLSKIDFEVMQYIALTSHMEVVDKDGKPIEQIIFDHKNKKMILK